MRVFLKLNTQKSGGAMSEEKSHDLRDFDLLEQNFFAKMLQNNEQHLHFLVVGENVRVFFLIKLLGTNLILNSHTSKQP